MSNRLKPELLAPAGNMESLNAALHFGADAVYFAAKDFSLRAGAENFDRDGLVKAAALCRAKGKKAYVACNIFAHNADFDALGGYIAFLSELAIDGLIVSDPGILALTRSVAPRIPVHLSTQANTTNVHSARFWASRGVKRIVLARELNLSEIKAIREGLPAEVELEAFVHGAMCVSYSGRCLLSNFMTGRAANRGECAQSCRREYEIREKSRGGDYLTLTEDARGSYILNSRDMNLIERLGELSSAGIVSFKIEGRAKSAYYVANVVNAYRRAIDRRFADKNAPIGDLADELYKSAHRRYFTGYYFSDEAYRDGGQHAESSKPVQTHRFIAPVTGKKDGLAEVEQRNRFCAGDTLEVLSPSDRFNKTLTVKAIFDDRGYPVETADRVQQKLYLETDLDLQPGDILRKKL